MCERKQKTPMGSEQTRTQPRVFQRETLTSYFFPSLGYERGNGSIIYFTDLCKLIETYIYARKKYPFASEPTEKHPNAANLRLQTSGKNQRT